MIKQTRLSHSVGLMFRGPIARHMPVPALLAMSLFGPSQVLAQVAVQADQGAAQGAANPPSVVVTGSRFSRIVTESATPVDLIPAAELARGGQLQLQSALKALVPSFSVSAPATSGTLDFTSTPTLRGLGPGELLLLVNGKRRHSSGILNTVNQIGRGDVGYDFSTIPTSAIGRAEVLRDGASAQYGADAIAGVINLVLDKSLGAKASVMSGMNTEGDGEVIETNASVGVPLGEDGVLRTSVRIQDRKISNRALPDTRQQYFGSNGTRTISSNYGSGTGLTPSNGTLDPREATIDRNTFWLGDAPFTSGAVFVNAEKPVGDALTLYAFGGYSKLDGDSYGFVRRAGQDETVRALYPDGFRPVLNVILENASLATGIKGSGLAGFDWDLSTQYGQSIVGTRRSLSNNASLGVLSPTTDRQGETRFGQWTSNFDVSREIALAAGAPLKLAAGLEFRKEFYRASAGDLPSYQNGNMPVVDGPNAGKPAPPGFQPSSGTTPGDASNEQRRSVAVYSELERQLSKRLMLSGAARYEHFSDFGSSATFKLATRYELSAPLALRGSVSSGFRAPNLAQSFTSLTTTTFLSGNPVTLRLLPVNSPIAQSLGATDLRPEKSRSISVGGVLSKGAFNLSGDVYRIAIDERLALSSTFQDARVTQLLAGLGFPSIGAVSYMTNAINTVTTGIDVTSSYRLRLNEMGMLNITAAANLNKTKIKYIAPTPARLAAIGITTPLYDLTQQVRLTDASPQDKYVLGLSWKKDDWTVNLNNIRYGEVASVAFTNMTPAQVAVVTQAYKVRLQPAANGVNSQVIQMFSPKIITDLNASYQMGNASLTVGVNNMFDIYPDRNMASTVASVAVGTNGSDNAGTFPYNYISPFGYTGRSVFAKLDYKF